MQELAQVGARLCLAGIRPKEKREVLAQLRSVTMQHQVGEQRQQAVGREGDLEPGGKRVGAARGLGGAVGHVEHVDTSNMAKA